MLFDNLGVIENNVLEMFLALDFPWKEKLIKQIQKSVVTTEYRGSSYFIDFFVVENDEPIALSNRVPIEILVDHASDDQGVSVFYKRQEILFPTCGDLSPTGFNLHMLDGVISEVEVYSLAGEILNLKNICNGRKYCFLFAE